LVKNQKLGLDDALSHSEDAGKIIVENIKKIRSW
jgi:hypothetical protein